MFLKCILHRFCGMQYNPPAVCTAFAEFKISLKSSRTCWSHRNLAKPGEEAAPPCGCDSYYRLNKKALDPFWGAPIVFLAD